MYLTPVQTIIMIGVITVGTMLTRFPPFFLFPKDKERPQVITYLGNVLPASMMGLLLVYCLRNVSLKDAPHGLPEGISLIFIFLIHKWKKNVLLSIGLGTALYMILIRVLG